MTNFKLTFKIGRPKLRYHGEICGAWNRSERPFKKCGTCHIWRRKDEGGGMKSLYLPPIPPSSFRPHPLNVARATFVDWRLVTPVEPQNWSIS